MATASHDGTRAVLLESACFDPARIHIVSTALGLCTESSHRFERGVDLGGVKWAARRAAALMVELAGARPAGGAIDAFPAGPQERQVSCRYRRINAILGVCLAPEEVLGKLRALQFDVVEETPEGCKVQVPSFRRDIEIEADLIEEVARLHGLDEIPEVIPAARIAPDTDDTPTRCVLACRNALVALGLSEIVNYSFVSSALLDLFDTDAVSRRVVLPNPVSADHAILRDALLPQVAQTLGNNVAHQNMDLRLFEMGRVFLSEQDGGIREEERVAIGLLGKTGRTPLDCVRPVDREEMFLWLKGVVAELLHTLKVSGFQIEPEDIPGLAPGWSAGLVIDGKPAGRLGLLAPAIAGQWRISEPMGVAELSRDALLKHVFDVPAAQRISPFPSVSRDLALIADAALPNERILAAIQDAKPPELTEVKLFDIFTGEGIGKGKRSLAYRFVYRSMGRSLTDEDVNEYQDKLRDVLEARFGLEIREG